MTTRRDPWSYARCWQRVWPRYGQVAGVQMHSFVRSHTIERDNYKDHDLGHQNAKDSPTEKAQGEKTCANSKSCPQDTPAML